MSRTPANRIFLAAQAGALLVTLLFATDLFLNRQSELAAGEERTRRFNAMMAEHTARTFDAVDILLREISGDISRNHGKWQKWSEDEGWNYLAQNHSRSMPQLRSLLLIDEQGQERFSSLTQSGERANIQRSNDFQEISRGKKTSRAGPFAEKISGHHSYALSHRLNDRSGNFTGLLSGTLETLYLQDFCWPNRLSEDFEAVLINATGEIVAACRPSDQGRQSPLLGHYYARVLFAGQLPETAIGMSSQIKDGFVTSVLGVPGYPELRMLTAIPEDSLLSRWHSRMRELGLLASLTIGIILSGGFLMRRQMHKVEEMNQAMAVSQLELEQRIKQATDQLARQRDHAELANVAKSRFLAAASHDLRQPMHALSLFATDLQTQTRSGTYRELPKLAEQIGNSTRLLSDLLDSLLDISRLDVSGIIPEIRHFALQKVFDRVYDAHKRNALEKKILLRFRFTRYWLNSDQALIERMIGNLVSNAVRYTPEGGRVLISARKRGNRVLIEIRDSGIGIAPEHQAAIFAEFYQVANAAREAHQGLGLGLSIVERLANALNVQVNLRSEANRGTLFSLLVDTGTPADHKVKTQASAPSQAQLYFIGSSSELTTARQLAETWGYPTDQQETLTSPLPPLPYNTVVIAPLEMAHRIRQVWPGQLTMILFVPEKTPAPVMSELPEGSRLCSLPVRPAKFRALLQNTSSKSIP